MHILDVSFIRSVPLDCCSKEFCIITNGSHHSGYRRTCIEKFLRLWKRTFAESHGYRSCLSVFDVIRIRNIHKLFGEGLKFKDYW